MQTNTNEPRFQGNPLRYVYEDSTGCWAVTGKDEFCQRSYMLTKADFEELKKSN